LCSMAKRERTLPIEDFTCAIDGNNKSGAR
jgi:hypothetical protein